jgi:ATP-binding cassette subfamily F protein uup
MLDRIATEYLALDGEGHCKEFPSFAMWQEWTKKPKLPKKKTKSVKERKKSETLKLSYILQREFDGMEQAIADAEAEVKEAECIANDVAVIADHQKHAKACAVVAEAQGRIRALYERWAELEGMQ